MISKNELLKLNIFEDNEYLDKYIDLIHSEQFGEKFERHHIIPRFYFKYAKLDVDNSDSNIVKLTVLNHIIAHFYLYRCIKDELLKNKAGLIFMYMSSAQQGINLNEEDNKILQHIIEYSKIKEAIDYGASTRGRVASEENRNNIRQAQYNRPKEVQEKMNAALAGQRRTVEQRAKMSESRKRFLESIPEDERKARLTHQVSESAKEKLRLANIGKKQSDDTKAKRRKSISKLKWFNDGKKNIRAIECPNGFVQGRINFKCSSNSAHKGSKHFTNGIDNIMADECPPGFVSGWTYKNK